MTIKTMEQLDLNGKRVLIREDLNVPIKDGIVTSDARIKACLNTIKTAQAKGAVVILMSHLGRPTEGEYEPTYSLLPVARHLASLLNLPVRFEKEWLDGVEGEPGDIILCENVRFNVGEKKNDDQLAKKMAALCDVFVMDAFGTAHRAQASTHGVAKYAPVCCAGPLLAAELDALGKALNQPAKPMLAIVGGAKVSTKLTVLGAMLDQVDQLIVGGGIANTFIAAQGHNVGQSLYEPDLIDEAKALMKKAQANGASIPVPVDVVCGKAFSANTEAKIKAVDAVEEDDLILDVGPKTAALYAEMVEKAKTIVWNGPLGVFEFPQFAEGTQVLSKAIAHSEGFSIAGGGDTLAAVDQFGIAEQVSYISTGGGAFLEFLEGKELPAVVVLDQ